MQRKRHKDTRRLKDTYFLVYYNNSEKIYSIFNQVQQIHFIELPGNFLCLLNSRDGLGQCYHVAGACYKMQQKMQTHFILLWNIYLYTSFYLYKFTVASYHFIVKSAFILKYPLLVSEDEETEQKISSLFSPNFKFFQTHCNTTFFRITWSTFLQYFLYSEDVKEQDK